MPKNKLPYFNTFLESSHASAEEKITANFVLRKFKPRIKEKFPQHYLVQPAPHKSLEFIKEKSRQHSYFCRFDIKRYYPSIDHSLLVEKIPEIYEKISGNNVSRRMKRSLKDILPLLSKNSPYGKGLAIGSPLSYVLSGIYLLSLDLEIPCPFLRQTDDYLVFCKRKNDPEKLLKEIITPKLSELGLELNEKKLSSGKFYKDKVDFIGFNFYAGYFSVKEEKKEDFKRKVIGITHLTRKKPERAVIKLLNNKILGFGHYYKHASCKKDFKSLDGFIRMRLRRWLLGQKELLPKKSNLSLTNNCLGNMGLKALTSINYPSQSGRKTKNQKNRKRRAKTGQLGRSENRVMLEELEFKYQQKELIYGLKRVTSLIKKIEKRLGKIEKKLDRGNGLGDKKEEWD